LSRRAKPQQAAILISTFVHGEMETLLAVRNQVLAHGRLVLASMAVVLTVLSANAKRKQAPAAPSPSDLPAYVNYLAKQLWGTHIDDSGALTSQIQQLTLDHITAWLQDRSKALPGPSSSGTGLGLGRGPADIPSDVQVRRELEKVFAQLHYPIYALPAAFEDKWRDKTLIGAGYTLGWSDFDRANVIGLYEIGSAGARLAAVTNFVLHTDLHYELMAPSASGNFRFIAYGTRLGKSQPRLTAVLYSFDGSTLKPLWKTEDAYDGRITVGTDWVMLRYLREDEYVRAVQAHRKPARYEAMYKATPQGLELQSEHPIPF
jgi:hypothetical protein